MARSPLWLLSAALLACIPFTTADVQFTSPKAGDTLTGGNAIVVEWKDSGSAPSITDLKTYQLFLCAGGNDDASIIQLAAITTAGEFTVTGNKATGTIGIGVGASTPQNAYFLKIISTGTSGGTVTNYSPRFALSGMTGTFPPNVITGLNGITGTDGPPTKNSVNDAANPAAPPDGDAFKVAYTMQTGLTRYAPMQPVPPTKITKQKQTPLYPTSGFTVAKSQLPNPPKQQTTITQSQTFSISSRENPASAAPMPSDDMAKFLARWKD